MGIKKHFAPLLLIFLVLTVFSQTWENDSLVIRQILDTNGLYTTPVDSAIGKKDSAGRVLYLGFGQPSFHIIPASIKLLDQVTLFGLGKTNVETIPPEIGCLKKIIILNIIGNNKLTSLPPEIGNLDSLVSLNISKNEITSIPPEIGNCKKLKIFKFQNNKITRIPDEFCNLVLLQKPWAQNNLISYIPEAIGNMPAFHSIDLDNNKLKHIPNSLIPYGLDDVHVCYNDSLVFTEEQKSAWGVTDYDDYFWKYCPVEVEEENIITKQYENSQIQISYRTVSFNVAKAGHVTCSVFNLNGSKIETLLDKSMSSGTHVVAWNQAHYAPGVYFIWYCSRGCSYSTKVVVK